MITPPQDKLDKYISSASNLFFSDVSSTTEKNKLEADEIYLSNLSCGGVIKDMTDFSQYNDTNRYRQVSTARDFLDALKDAKIEYTTEIVNGEVVQNVTKEAPVNVIEITQDLDLGYNVISKAIDNLENYDVLDWFDHKYDEAGVFIDPYISKSGISQIKIENMSNLLIYSKNGSKIKHAGFKVTSCYNLAIRNLDFDEIWMWEDTSSATPSFNIGDYDNQAWAYFKIAYSENIWIDHCSFGKSYDGQIDVSNANSLSLPNRIPYGSKVLGGGVHISYCSFTSGTDEDGNIRDYITELYNNLSNE